jgi:hypothetical protein
VPPLTPLAPIALPRIVDTSAIEVLDGTRAIEVAAMFEDAVVDVRHFSDPKSGVVTRATKGLLASAGAAFVAALVLFLVSYVQVGRMEAQKQAWERDNTPMAERIIPREGPAVDIASSMLLAFGIGALLVGLARLLEERQPRDFTIGPDRVALFNTPGELLPVGAFPLVRSTGEDYELLFTAGMTGDVEIAGEKRTLGELAQGGQARPSAEVSGAFAWAIPHGARAKIDLGQTTFLVSSVPAPRRHASPLVVDWSQQAYTGGVALVTALLLLMIFSIPPDPKSLSLDAFLNENRYAKFVMAPPVEEQKIPEWLKKAPVEEDASGKKGQAHVGERGAMGEKKSTNRDGAYSIKGPKNNTDIRLAKTLAADAVKTAGILGVLQANEGGHIASIFGKTSALGNEAEDVLGHLSGSQIAEAHGDGALDTFGKGPGGGGPGEGTIGVDRLGTIGRAGRGVEGASYGSGKGHMHTHRPSQLELDPKGEVKIRGSLDKEVIRRVIRMHLNEMKFCYEQQLLKRPDLFGRVVVQFTIAGTGAVLVAGVQSSSMNAPEVDRCVADAVHRLTFPKPEGGGIVMVSYPFAFKAAGDN